MTQSSPNGSERNSRQSPQGQAQPAQAPWQHSQTHAPTLGPSLMPMSGEDMPSSQQQHLRHPAQNPQSSAPGHIFPMQSGSSSASQEPPSNDTHTLQFSSMQTPPAAASTSSEAGYHFTIGVRVNPLQPLTYIHEFHSYRQVTPVNLAIGTVQD